jgi:hypothetical protein
LKVNSNIISGVNSFKVLVIDFTNNVISLQKVTPSSTLVKRDLIDLKTPTFIHGSRLVANAEWKAITNDSDKRLPLIWLYEVIDGIEASENETYDESRLTLFFLEWYNPQTSLVNEVNGGTAINQIRKQGVIPMLGLEREFIKVIEESDLIEIRNKFTKKTHSRFVNENDSIREEKQINNDPVRQILGESLGGVEIRPTLHIYKLNNCC